MKKTFMILAVMVALMPFQVAGQVKTGFGIQTIYPFSLKNGKGAPVNMVNAFYLDIPLTDKLSGIIEPGFQTGLTFFQPNPQLALGMNFKIAEKFILGFRGMYRYLPNYSGGASTDGYLIGTLVVPIFPIINGIGLLFPSGIAHNTITREWIGVFSIRLNVPLPF